MKKLIILLLMAAGVFSLSGCGNREVKDAANDAAEIFANGDIEEINYLIFGTQELELDEEVRTLLGETDEDTQQNGVMSAVFSESTISVRRVGKETVEFEIVAPNMENVFLDFPIDNAELTEEDLLMYVEDYAAEAEAKSFIVDVPYITSSDGEVEIDYCNEAFVNAVSGGLLDAYKQLYMDALQEYRGEK